MVYSNGLNVAAVLLFIVFGVCCRSRNNIDVDLSARLASSGSRAQVVPHIKELWIYLVPRGVDPRSPVDFSKVKPNVVLTNQEVKKFIALLESSGERGEKLDKKKVAPHSYGCYVFCQPEYAAHPAYLWCDIFADGRAYVSIYTGRDSAGMFNRKLGAFIEDSVAAKSENGQKGASL